MEIHGREVNFLRTVEANCKIADICPDGDINKATQLFSGSYQKVQKTTAKFMAILSEGYEKRKNFNDKTYEPNPLTAEEALCLTDEEFNAAFVEAFRAYNGEKPTVETEVKKTAKGKKKE